MHRELATAARAIVVLTLVLGLAYPLAMTGVAQVAFPHKANGSQIAGHGSRLIARPMKGARYFQPRPSQSEYSATASFFSNRGPNSAVARFFYRDALAAYLTRERRYSPGLTARRVPVDAVTTSGSGVDPHVSKANARIQARRVAAVRGIPVGRVDDLVDDHTDGRFLGVLGEPGVNVLELNLALDKEAR